MRTFIDAMSDFPDFAALGPRKLALDLGRWNL
jgi:hypothetical protein